MMGNITQRLDNLEIIMAEAAVSYGLILGKLDKLSLSTPTENIEDNIIGTRFPVTEICELEELEDELKANLSFKSQLVRKLGTLGGNDATKTARTISKYLFDDKVLEKFSWQGTANKRAFSAFKEIIYIIGQAVKKHFPDCENRKFLQNHLKFASFRLTNFSRKERNTTKKTGTDNE